MNVVVTGGGTIAPIDDVRHIANASTGRFSAEITEACLARGARVWHVHAPLALRPFHRHAQLDLDADPDAESARLADLRRRYREAAGRLTLVGLPTGTIDEYARALRDVLTARRVDVAFLAMAASDFEPVPVAGKLDSDRPGLTIRCRRSPKVIRAVRDWAPGTYLVGFKLLSGAPVDELIRAAEVACVVNRADLTVANDLRLLRAGRHTVHLVRPGAAVETLGPGPGVAEGLVERVWRWVAEESLARAQRPQREGAE